MNGGVVVVGGGFGALEVALALKAVDRRIPLTVVSSETAVVYRPWLIRVPAGRSQPPVIPSARLLVEAGVDVIAGRAATADLERRRLILDSGDEVAYSQLVVATGATADRDRVPGAREHALFPCDPADAVEFAARVQAGSAEVAVVFGWERPGPGLEYAAWISAHRRGVRVTVIDGDGTLERRFGAKATAWLQRLFESRGARLISEGPLEQVREGHVEFAGGSVSADLIALVSPLRGNTDWLPADLVDPIGRLRVDETMAATAGVFGIGDVVAVPGDYRFPPTLRSIQATARGVALNVARAHRGDALQAVLRPRRPAMLVPDLAGVALLVRDRRLLLAGRLPLLIRSLGEHRYLRSRNAQDVSS
jgi:NADH:ubiquinone reductase (H+-translocating)